MRKLGRTSDHRQAMLRAMVTFLLENGKIETTVTRAKEVSREDDYPWKEHRPSQQASGILLHYKGRGQQEIV